MKEVHMRAFYHRVEWKRSFYNRDLDLLLTLAEPAPPRFRFATPMTDDDVEEAKNPKITIRTQNIELVYYSVMQIIILIIVNDIILMSSEVF